MLSRQGCELLVSTLSKDFLTQIQRELRVVPYSAVSVQRPASFDVFRKLEDRYIVPHFWGVDQCHARGIQVQECRRPGTHVALTFAGDLRPHQKPLVEQALRKLVDGGGGCVLCAGTGDGKTAMALYIACQLQQQCLVLVHKTFLAEQWKDRIRTFIPNARVSMYGNGTYDCSGQIVIATIQTVLSRGMPDPFRNGVGLLIVDEVHRIAAPAFSKVLVGLNAPHILGLSATPERADKLTRLLYWLCGPRVTTDTPSQTHDSTIHIHRVTFKNTMDIPLNRRNDVDHATLLTQLSEDDRRTAFLVQEILKHIPKTADCLVLSHRRAHCQLLSEVLRQQGYDAQTYLGGDTSVPTAKVLVSTYSLVSEGFDEPRLSCLVFATPASNITQAFGRILRRPGPKTVIDLVDTNPVCYAQAAKRKHFYVSRGYLDTPKQPKTVYLFK